MNHSRPVRLHRVRLRFLVLVPVLLLGAAWLARARLPQPPTAGDKVLWEMAETAPVLNVGARDSDWEGQSLKLGFAYPQRLTIRDRHGIRAALRAFHGTPAFMPTRVSRGNIEWLVWIAFSPSDGRQVVGFAGHKGYYFLFLTAPDGTMQYTLVDDASAQRFLQTLRGALREAQRKQPGYLLSPAMGTTPP